MLYFYFYFTCQLTANFDCPSFWSNGLDWLASLTVFGEPTLSTSPAPSNSYRSSVHGLLCYVLDRLISLFIMPFRDKMKRAFGKPGDEDSDLTQVSSKASKNSRKEKKQKREYPNNVYKPGEVMPRPKYRAVYNKEHQDKLSSFSFGTAWKRRKSEQSEYSPMGSRLPSISLRRLSLGTGQRSRKQSRVAEKVDENMDGDDDVGNGGLGQGRKCFRRVDGYG